MILNCVVVDDSSMQRLSIIKLIENHANLNLIAEYRSALEAKNGLNTLKVDFIFLDTEMPVLNGFELIDSLKTKPKVIFISDKKDFAFKAFEYHAIDYLLKPLTKERFNSAIEKVLVQYKVTQNTKQDKGDYIFVKSNLKKRKVFINDIKWVEALGDYIELVTEENKLVILSTMKAFEKELPKNKFLRIHKSYIVNSTKINRFNSKNVEIGSFQIPLSRNKKTQLANVLNDI